MIETTLLAALLYNFKVMFLLLSSTNDYHVIEDLPNGKYTAQETEAPKGYILDTTPHSIV